jgi:hypothetical protein
MPATEAPFVRIGTRALAEGAWLLGGDDVAGQLREKGRILSEHHDEVVVTTATAEAACRELAGLIGGTNSLEAAARTVAEDLCVLLNDGGQWVLAAGVVCFPSHWRLRDKVGRPLAEIHGPVPDYVDELADKVDRFVDRLRPERPVWRRNWTIHTSPELYTPEPVHGDELWLRSERQTLRRLPETQAVAFTIRTQQVPLATVKTHDRLRQQIAKAVASWPDNQVAYRGGPNLQKAVLTTLRS